MKEGGRLLSFAPLVLLLLPLPSSHEAPGPFDIPS